MTRLDCQLRANRVAIHLSVAMAALIVLHVASALIYWTEVADSLDLHFWQIAIFDLDEEESFGTWFSAGILGFASLLLFLQAHARRGAGDPAFRSWWVLGLGFAGLSMDEVAGVHEYLNTLLEDTPWTLIGAIVAGIVGLAFLPFLWKLPPHTRILFLIAGAIYLGGALGVERFTDTFDTTHARNTLAYNLWNTLEEGMEMSGVILFLYALISHMAGGAQATLTVSTAFSGEAIAPDPQG